MYRLVNVYASFSRACFAEEQWWIQDLPKEVGVDTWRVCKCVAITQVWRQSQIWSPGEGRSVTEASQKLKALCHLHTKEVPKVKDLNDRQTASCIHDQPLILASGGRLVRP